MKHFIKDMAERAIKTFFQVLAGFFTAGLYINEIDWFHALIVSGTAAAASVITSMSCLKLGDKNTASAVKRKENQNEQT
jgi:hypothetical protein